MDVKASSGGPPPPARMKSECGVGTATAELVELLGMMPRVFRGLKRGAEPGGEESGPRSALRSLFKGGELGPRHIPVLVMLALEGQLAVGELAHRLGLNVATVSLMVGELARAGLVERTEDEQDRRRTLVSIAERHQGHLGPFVDDRIAPVRRALERMSPEAREAFLAGWRLLAEEIDHSP